MEWQPKATAEESNNTNTQQQEIQTEPVVDIQVNNRGKQAVVTQGATGKPKQAEINYEELARRNAFAPLRILERTSIEGQLQKIRMKMGIDWHFKDNYEYAPNGRIWLIWKEANVHVAVLENTDQMIHCLVKDKNSAFTSYITFVYGLHTTQHRIPLWRSLRNMQTTGPWLIIGDFNSVLNVDDRVNRISVHQAEIIDFQNCLDDIGVGQITKRGSSFSWCNKRDADEVQGKLNEDYFNNQLIEDERRILKSIEKWEAIHEQIMRQKSRATWIQLGDCNTKYFHAYMKARQARNKRIHPADELPGIDVSIARNGPCLTLAQQQQLLQAVTPEEICQIVKNLPNDKAPGMDGYPPEFFKEFWPIIGQEVIEAVQQFFQTGKLLKKINCTTVTLISKVKNPSYVKEFRPIACCSTMYKIIAKLLTNRLKLVVDLLVGHSQSAFIEGRNILDNVIMAHELIKGYSQKAVSPICMIEVDIRKAYDSVEWSFFKAVLLEFGIPYKMIALIMECVSTVSYTLLLNGGLADKFAARKGLRQGDPMSPYLFVLAMEYLNRSLKTLNQNSDFNFHPKCAELADEVSVKLVMKIFDHLSKASGLQANLEKSSLYIAGVPMVFKARMLAELQLSTGSIPFKYLGVPLSSRKITIQQCMPLVEKMVERIRSWTSKLLSYAGRLQLIKSVLFEMQTYWAQKSIAWETLCKPKAAGGLNIINYERWNKAALTKLLWALMAKKDKLWIKWIHSHYIKQKDIITMETPKQASWIVKKLFTSREWWANDIPTIESFAQNGKFSIQKAYLHATPKYPKVHWKALVMLTGILPKQHFILWMAIQRRLATVDRLAKWRIQVNHSCVLCGGDIEETHDHLYFECPYSQSLWKGLLEWLSYKRRVEIWEAEVQWLTANVNNRNPRKNVLRVVFAAVVYYIWMERNARRFQNQSKEIQDRAKEIVLRVHITGQKKCKWTPILNTLNSYPNCNS
ncbi:PREDICTED: uncharacterized protein LOC109233767 [Nicotiana attenuata]|uniref:uncharacterized protein LOC109233767 n=1 Tax=Nicotiana attenuata TaxID=49451 RepID=UPI00090587E4|nr:PREDICTED: uncharacterized protein LOC109233767 [Nicotiana attenuata]